MVMFLPFRCAINVYGFYFFFFCFHWVMPVKKTRLRVVALSFNLCKYLVLFDSEAGEKLPYSLAVPDRRVISDGSALGNLVPIFPAVAGDRNRNDLGCDVPAQHHKT